MANEWGWEMEGWKGWRSVEIKSENEEKRTGKRKILQRDRGGWLPPKGRLDPLYRLVIFGAAETPGLTDRTPLTQ